MLLENFTDIHFNDFALENSGNCILDVLIKTNSSLKSVFSSYTAQQWYSQLWKPLRTDSSSSEHYDVREGITLKHRAPAQPAPCSSDWHQQGPVWSVCRVPWSNSGRGQASGWRNPSAELCLELCWGLKRSHRTEKPDLSQTMFSITREENWKEKKKS